MTPPSDTAHPEGELLSCPFCGGDGEISWYAKGKNPECAGYFVECTTCSASGEGFDIQGEMPDRDDHTKSRAIRAWNTRPVVRPQGEEGLASAFIDHRGNELRCSTAVYQEIRRLRDQAGLERAPVEMLVDADWLRRRAEADPDEECEARPALSNQGKPSS